MRRKNKTRIIVHVLITVFFAVSVIAPILSMLRRITPDGFRAVIYSAQFGEAVVNSLTTALTATIISLILALLAAFCIERTSLKGKVIFNMFFVIPMLIPSISHAFGLVALFGANGLLTRFLGIDGGIYGFWGIVAGSVMYSFPVAFLMFKSILQYEDGMAYRAAGILGIPAFWQFTGITFPYLKKTMISAFFAIFTMIITDYGVPLMIGGKIITLSTLMYSKAVAMLDYDAGSVIGAFLLIPAVIAFLVDMMNSESAHSGFVNEQVEEKKGEGVRLLAAVLCILLSACILLPILSFCIMVFETKYPVDMTFTLHHIEKTMNRGAGKYLLNSVMYSALAACMGTGLAFLCAYLTARINGVFSRGLHLISVTSMAIPGIVLGLSYVIFFSKMPIYGTILIIVLANSIHFFASPYLMMYNTLGKVNMNLEAVGKTLGIKKVHIVVDVIVPKVKYTLYEMFAYFFVNSMMTISAVSFLAPPSPKPIALMINQFEAQLLMESAAFVSLLILLINFILKGFIAVIKFRAMKK